MREIVCTTCKPWVDGEVESEGEMMIGKSYSKVIRCAVCDGHILDDEQYMLMELHNA